MTYFEEIYRKYFSDVFAFILRLSGDVHVAEDITSDTFIKAMKALDKFRGDCDIRVWLCQIAKNCYYSHLRKTNKEEYTDEAELIDTTDVGNNVEDQLIKKERLAEIRKALHEIPDQYKEVYMWRIFAQLSFQQIGKIFGKSENWACVTYHRAIGMIKKKIEDESDV
ncbi:MAG: sigma-70 family RNA polymerase sigma factor [Firmicutes bacterium]|nr:sigma-70 family RNA polymerase sigma factor [Bacillota bacterium]